MRRGKKAKLDRIERAREFISLSLAPKKDELDSVYWKRHYDFQYNLALKFPKNSVSYNRCMRNAARHWQKWQEALENGT